MNICRTGNDCVNSPFFQDRAPSLGCVAAVSLRNGKNRTPIKRFEYIQAMYPVVSSSGASWKLSGKDVEVIPHSSDDLRMGQNPAPQINKKQLARCDQDIHKVRQAVDVGIAFMPAQHPVPVPVCKTGYRLSKVRESFPGKS